MRIYRQPERCWGFVRSHVRGMKRLEVEGKDMRTSVRQLGLHLAGHSACKSYGLGHVCFREVGMEWSGVFAFRQVEWFG